MEKFLLRMESLFWDFVEFNLRVFEMKVVRGNGLNFIKSAEFN